MHKCKNLQTRPRVFRNKQYYALKLTTNLVANYLKETNYWGAQKFSKRLLAIGILKLEKFKNF